MGLNLDKSGQGSKNLIDFDLIKNTLSQMQECMKQGAGANLSGGHSKKKLSKQKKREREGS